MAANAGYLLDGEGSRGRDAPHPEPTVDGGMLYPNHLGEPVSADSGYQLF
jgi:hypothetical protein